MSESIADLIDRLLASSKVSGDTRGELVDFKQQLLTGQLDEGDKRYVEALGQRLLGSGAPTGDSDESEDLGSQWDLGDDPELEALRQCVDSAAGILRDALDSEDPAAQRVALTAALGILEGGRSAS